MFAQFWEMVTVGEKIRLARRYARPSMRQEDLSGLLGKSRSLIAKWETDAITPSPGELQKLAYALGIDIQWFYDGRQGPPPVQSPPEGSAGTLYPGRPPSPPFRDGQSHQGVGRRLFPVAGFVGASEHPMLPGDQDPEDWEEFSDRLFSNERDRYVVRVRGNSMEDSWREDDLALIDPVPNFQVSGVYVAAINSEGALLKVLMVHKGQLFLVPENPEFEISAVVDDGWTMLGPVLAQKRARSQRSGHEIFDIDGLRPDRRPMAEITMRFRDFIAQRTKEAV